MKSPFFVTLILLIHGSIVFAQGKPEPFEISLPAQRVSGSLYNSILFMDIRRDTTGFGMVQKGAINRNARVVAKIPMAQQFSNVLNALTDSTAQSGELLLAIRHCRFGEITGAVSEKGYFFFRADLFARDGNEYKKIASIDTVTVITAMDVTQKNFKNGSKVITDFIVAHLTQKYGDDFSLSANQIPKLDSIEKSKLPLYTNPNFVDGVYYNYRSFSLQRPDVVSLSVSFDRKGKPENVSSVDGKGNKITIDSHSIYAFVSEGKPYIAGEFNYYPLEKRKDDFYFVGRASDVKTSNVMAAEIMFGIIGGLLAQSATSVFEMRIDHLSGDFIKIKEAKTGR
jgi:hypothetical protein